MCCLLNGKDRRQLSALLWRWKTVVARNKMSLCKALIPFILMVFFWVLLYSAVKPFEMTLRYGSLEEYAVSTPSMDGTKSLFCRDGLASEGCADQELGVNSFQTSILFENCTKIEAYDVGIIYPQDGEG